MPTITTRAARWPLAFTLVALVGQWVEVTVTNTSGNTEVGSLRWAANQIGSGGGVIHFAPSLDGAGIILNGTLSPDGPMYIDGPAKGITISGNHSIASSTVLTMTDESA
jgi:hypothetical protein